MRTVTQVAAIVSAVCHSTHKVMSLDEHTVHHYPFQDTFYMYVSLKLLFMAERHTGTISVVAGPIAVCVKIFFSTSMLSDVHVFCFFYIWKNNLNMGYVIHIFCQYTWWGTQLKLFPDLSQQAAECTPVPELNGLTFIQAWWIFKF
jgi:hypothetical protein